MFLLPNLYGDIITDEAAQIQGGVGTAGSANLGSRYAMFEAIHGSAPRMVEEGLADYANPSSIFKAAEMLLRCLGGKKRGAVSELAVRLERKKTTREDLAALLERCRAVCAAALLLPYGCQPEESDREIAAFLAKNLTKTQIMRTIELLQKYHGEWTYNVGASHVLGALAVELEGIL